jgi:hypothetical protein
MAAHASGEGSTANRQDGQESVSISRRALEIFESRGSSFITISLINVKYRILPLLSRREKTMTGSKVPLQSGIGQRNFAFSFRTSYNFVNTFSSQY